MSRWKFAQNKELECWSQNAYKVGSLEYRQAKESFWNDVLRAIGVSVSKIKEANVLEIGSGPTGLFLLASDNPKYVALDPLMDEYKKLYNYFQDTRIQTENLKVEEYNTAHTFDYIVGFNAIDHVDDVAIALRRLRELAHEKTVVVLSMNVHTNGIIQRIVLWLSVLLDPLHKHQYTQQQYEKMCKEAGFKVVKKVYLDDELRTLESALERGAPEKNTHKSIRYYIHPGNIFFGILEKVFRLPRYAHRSQTGKSVYTLVCFVLSKS